MTTRLVSVDGGPPAPWPAARDPIRAIGDRVVIRPVEAATMVGKLHIPEAHARRPTKGVVVSVGPDVGDALEPGALVWYRKYDGDEVEIGGVTLLIVGIDGVLMVET